MVQLSFGLGNAGFVDYENNNDPEKGDYNQPPAYENHTSQNIIDSLHDDSSKLDEAKEKEGAEVRQTWDNPIEFILSCISMSIDVWRFPYTVYSNGGGAFLIPYLIILTVIGRPIYYLEMCLGQFASSGQVKVWNLSPVFRGVGFCSMVGAICTCSYYVSIMAQTVFYLFASFNDELPWSKCNLNWEGGICNPDGTINDTATNDTIATLYYNLEVFPKKDDISDGLGAPDLRLSMCLVISWIILFLALWKGVQSSGKVAYVTAILPYIVLIIMLIRAATLEGAWTGIMYLFKPNWEKMADAKVWYAAVSQCFFSLGTGYGLIINYSSYNPFRHNLFRDATILTLTDTFTSILAACTVFAVLGFLANETGRDVATVLDKGGFGLTFVSYPEAIAQFTFVPQIFAILFFLMLLSLEVGTAVAFVTAVVTIVCDKFPNLNKSWTIVIVSLFGFFSGLIYLTPGGLAILNIVDYFGAGGIIYIAAMVEVAAISWVYGLDNFCRDIDFMLGIPVGWYWRICWGFISPVGLLGIFTYVMITDERLPYPDSAIISGWTLAAIGVGLVPLLFVNAILNAKGEGMLQKFITALKPTKEWGPADPQIRKEWIDFKKGESKRTYRIY